MRVIALLKTDIFPPKIPSAISCMPGNLREIFLNFLTESSLTDGGGETPSITERAEDFCLAPEVNG
jgi:hypothetical protein